MRSLAPIKALRADSSPSLDAPRLKLRSTATSSITPSGMRAISRVSIVWTSTFFQEVVDLLLAKRLGCCREGKVKKPEKNQDQGESLISHGKFSDQDKRCLEFITQKNLSPFKNV